MLWPSPNTCLGMIGQNGGDSASRIAGCGAESRITAMLGAGVSTRSTGANIDWNGWFALIVMIEKATSSEVIGLPSWNVAPGTSRSSSDRPSSWKLQLSAR